MRVIFSRKGVDSTAGRIPSPIVDGVPHSLPIPTAMPSRDRYRDLGDQLRNYIEVQSRGRLSGDDLCHIDPDIDRTRKPRGSSWRGALGQASAARTHLLRRGVQAGDLFLFFGVFRDATAANGALIPIGPKKHVVWGWMQVDHVIELGRDGRHVLAEFPWLDTHPHVSDGWGDDNTLFVGAEQLCLGQSNGHLPGCGVFRRGFTLTHPSSELASVWSVPDWLNPLKGGVGMSYHRSPKVWGEDKVRSAGRGQEFVTDITGRDDAQKWLVELIEGHA